MQAEHSLIPVGQMEGMACVSLSVPQVVSSSELTALLLGTIRPGTHAVWLREAPWGKHEWDDLLLRVLADERWHEMQVMAMRSVDAQAWAGVHIAWVGDASSLLKTPTTPEGVREALLISPYRPRLDELVAIDPDPANIVPAVLDELYSIIDPQVAAWIYLDGHETDYARTVDTLSSCATPWGVRLRHGGTV